MSGSQNYEGYRREWSLWLARNASLGRTGRRLLVLLWIGCCLLSSIAGLNDWGLSWIGWRFGLTYEERYLAGEEEGKEIWGVGHC